MFFDRYEINIQAFVDFINGEFVISDPHLHKIISRKIYIQNKAISWLVNAINNRSKNKEIMEL